MTKEPSTLEGMQPDHRLWDYELSAWRVDIARCRKEHESALSELTTLQDIIGQHGNALDAHAETMERHQDGLRDHDRAMAEFKRKRGGPLQEEMEKEHREHAETSHRS